MNNQPSAVIAETVTTSYPCCSLPSLCWGTIIGGTIAAIAIQILLSVLGVLGMDFALKRIKQFQTVQTTQIPLN